MKEHILRDSGKRQTFITGAVRDLGSGKGRYDLISPIGLRRLALIYEKGCSKYTERNWEKGMPTTRTLESAIRHIYQYIEGYREEDHLAQAAWNLFAVMHIEECVERGLLPKELVNTPNYLHKLDIKRLDENNPTDNAPIAIARRKENEFRVPTTNDKSEVDPAKTIW